MTNFVTPHPTLSICKNALKIFSLKTIEYENT